MAASATAAASATTLSATAASATAAASATPASATAEPAASRCAMNGVGPLELLVIQPTPFCNLDCSYCYLPDRLNTRKMSPTTLERTFDWVFSSGLATEPFELLWHAGEPMVMPPAFYDRAAELLARHDPDGTRVTQSFQTNGTLIDDEWCRLI